MSTNDNQSPETGEGWNPSNHPTGPSFTTFREQSASSDGFNSSYNHFLPGELRIPRNSLSRTRLYPHIEEYSHQVFWDPSLRDPNAVSLPQLQHGTSRYPYWNWFDRVDFTASSLPNAFETRLRLGEPLRDPDSVSPGWVEIGIKRKHSGDGLYGLYKDKRKRRKLNPPKNHLYEVDGVLPGRFYSSLPSTSIDSEDHSPGLPRSTVAPSESEFEQDPFDIGEILRQPGFPYASFPSPPFDPSTDQHGLDGESRFSWSRSTSIYPPEDDDAEDYYYDSEIPLPSPSTISPLPSPVHSYTRERPRNEEAAETLASSTSSVPSLTHDDDSEQSPSSPSTPA